MGNMNLSQIQAAVRGVLGELESDHPRIVAGDHTRCINKAPGILIRMFPDKFPEHRDQTWTDDPTVVGENSKALPSNLLVLQAVRHSEGATITSGNWSSIEEQVVSPSDPRTIGLLNKDADVANWPRLYARKGNNLLYHPTTRTGYATTFRYYGISDEEPLSAAGDTFRMDRQFDDVIVLLSAAGLARIMGQPERAIELETAAKREVGEGLAVANYEAGTHYIEPIWTFDSGGGF